MAIMDYGIICANIVHYRSIGDPQLEEMFQGVSQASDDDFDWFSSTDTDFDSEGNLFFVKLKSIINRRE